MLLKVVYSKIHCRVWSGQVGLVLVRVLHGV